MAGFRVIELVAEAHQRTNQASYDPCPNSLPGGSNTPPVQTPEVDCEQSEQDTGSDTSSFDDDDSVEGEDPNMDEVEAEMNAQEILK